MNNKPHILVIDDEPSIRLTLETGLSLKGFQVVTAASGGEGLEFLQKQDFDAVLCDILMPDISGLDLLQSVRKVDNELPLILMTAQGNLETAVTAVGEGASDFIAKPFEISTLAQLIKSHLEAKREEQNETDENEQNLSAEFSKSGLIGQSPAMVSVYKLIAYAARTDATVLIEGESGTGKELVAKAIHQFSDRRNRKIVSVNCAGLTDTLLEAELFGYEKGSFTGANSSREGLFEAANGGTIFLDELSSTSPAFQASLLRVLQSGEIRRVGSTVTKQVDVRVIGASNGNLQKMSDDGDFRSDLYYRLSVLSIEIPPLRERMSDVPLLSKHFLQKNEQANESIYLSKEVFDTLSNYKFPGNVRELENALIRAVALSRGNLITIDCLPPSIIEAGKNHSDSSEENPENLIEDRPTWDELQRRYLALTLLENGGNRRQTAEKLGIDRRTVQRLIARYELFASDEEE